LTYTASGLVNNDPLSTITGALGTTATAASPVGPYPFTLGTLSAGSNYKLVLAANLPTFAVTPAPLLASAVNFSATAGAPFSGTVATFTNVSPNTSPYTAVINWGDNSSNSTLTLTPSSSGNITLTVTGAHTYAAANAKGYTVTVTLSNPNVMTTTVTDTATVTSLNQAVGKGLTGTIGFWDGPQGQALITGFNVTASTPNPTALACWLKATFPNLYSNLAITYNADVAAYYLTLFNQGGQKVQAQVLAAALGVYATTASLGGNTGVAYGFNVSATGLGADSFNVGSDGAAFGVPNNTTLTVYGLLLAVNNQSSNGILYNGSPMQSALQKEAGDLFASLNQTGDIA
jgi:hypothetical protein